MMSLFPLIFAWLFLLSTQMEAEEMIVEAGVISVGADELEEHAKTIGQESNELSRIEAVSSSRPSPLALFPSNIPMPVCFSLYYSSFYPLFPLRFPLQLH
jgi:hypothetical protein